MSRDDIETGSPAHWLQFARADLAFAHIPLPPEGLYEQLCFHAQQAAEKAIKAVLVKLRIEFPFTHYLQALVSLLPADLVNIPELRTAANLNSYAVLDRYPGDEDFVTEEEFRGALQIAEAVVAWAEAIINKS